MQAGGPPPQRCTPPPRPHLPAEQGARACASVRRAAHARALHALHAAAGVRAARLPCTLTRRTPLTIRSTSCRANARRCEPSHRSTIRHAPSCPAVALPRCAIAPALRPFREPPASLAQPRAQNAPPPPLQSRAPHPTRDCLNTPDDAAVGPLSLFTAPPPRTASPPPAISARHLRPRPLAGPKRLLPANIAADAVAAGAATTTTPAATQQHPRTRRTPSTSRRQAPLVPTTSPRADHLLPVVGTLRLPSRPLGRHQAPAYADPAAGAYTGPGGGGYTTPPDLGLHPPTSSGMAPDGSGCYFPDPQAPQTHPACTTLPRVPSPRPLSSPPRSHARLPPLCCRSPAYAPRARAAATCIQRGTRSSASRRRPPPPIRRSAGRQRSTRRCPPAAPRIA